MPALFPLLALTMTLALASAPTPVDEASEIASLKSALDATQIPYATSPSGLSYTVLFDHPGNRKQTLYVAVKPGKASGLRAHTIYTTVWINKDAPPDDALMKKYLGQTKKLGAFYLFKDSKGIWAMRFVVNFDVTDLKESSASGDKAVTTLKDMIYFVNQVGEETDKEINGDKDIR
jgi:hypothetical protein